MNSKERRKDSNKRWKVISSDSPEEAFKKFKQRIKSIFQSIYLMCGDIHNTYYSKGIDAIVTDESSLDFCLYYGIQEKYYDNNKVTIIDRLNSETDEKSFYQLLEVILSLNIKDAFAQTGIKTKQYLINKVKEAIEMSDVNVAIGQSENDIILYPKGEKKLDEELVNKTLSFLNKESNKHFEEALRFYQDKKPIKSAESLRRSLEEFLRYKLENQKGLKQNIQVFQGKLKEQESQPEIRNIIFQTFDYLDNFFNEHSKHGDGNINEPENEFLIYQTGLLMRYINTLDKLKK